MRIEPCRVLRIASVAGLLLLIDTDVAKCQQPAAVAPCVGCTPQAVDWTTWSSTYTHRDGLAVDQYVPHDPAVTAPSGLRTTGVYRNHRSSLQGNTSADHYHRVDSYGPPVVPYGQWRYPYRPFSVPYGAWASPLPNVYAPQQFGPWQFNSQQPGSQQPGQSQPFGSQSYGPQQSNPWPGYGGGFPGHGGVWPGYGEPASGWPANQPTLGGAFLPGPVNALAPTQDDYHPAAPEPPQLDDRAFFFDPSRQR